jgi:FKBP-type peptidyl-prolyl cis-trans isomerase (trigger factor)
MAFAALVVPVSLGCQGPVPEPTPDPKPSAAPSSQVVDPPELVSEDLKVGEGREAKTGDKIKVNYVGRLLRTNFKFDSNEGKKPFEFKIGEGVIEGWSKGVVGMKVGGKRKLTIPSKLAYGDHGSPPKIPANAPLVFEVELLGFSDEDATDAGVTDAGATDAGATDAGATDAGAKKDDKKEAVKKDEPKKDAPKKPEAPKP